MLAVYTNNSPIEVKFTTRREKIKHGKIKLNLIYSFYTLNLK